MARLVAALSGGVDSAVAAARMTAAGHDVTAVHLALSRHPASQRTGSRGCCSLEDANDARRVADQLGLPFYVWDLSEPFQRDVVADFVSEYAAGRTPNPCLRCNERIKFAAVLERALSLGFDGVVTGHYARVERTSAEAELWRAADPAKDQSYVLAVITQEQLRRAYFPLGDTPKAQVRREAAGLGLRVADKPDSYDICFVADGDTPGWLRDKLGARPGPIVDQSGAVLGHHQGAFAFTVGQRRGLRLTRPAADGRPRHVLRVEAETNTVVVGPRAALRVDQIHGCPPLWIAGRPPAGPFPAAVQLRAHGRPLPAVVSPTAEGVRVDLLEPADGLASGQTAVFYDGDQVVGSATVVATAATGTADDSGAPTDASPRTTDAAAPPPGRVRPPTPGHATTPDHATTLGHEPAAGRPAAAA